jgi:hypothetical protein
MTPHVMLRVIVEAQKRLLQSHFGQQAERRECYEKPIMTLVRTQAEREPRAGHPRDETRGSSACDRQSQSRSLEPPFRRPSRGPG